MPSLPASQLSPHRAERVDLPSRYGPIAALHGRARNKGRAAAATVLMVPGYTGSKEDFAPLLDPITRVGFDAIAIDLPGQNESAGPTEESAYLPSALGLVLSEVIGRLSATGTPMMLVGHSYGGLVARSAVLAGAPVVGLTLMDSGPAELPQGWRRQALDIGEPAIRQHGIAAAQRLRDSLDAHNPAWLAASEELRTFLRERFLRSNPASLLGMAHGLRTEPDLVGALARLLQSSGAQSLVVCGERDDAWPVSAQRDMADRLDADFAVIPGAGHCPAIENPDGLLDILVPTWRTWLSYAELPLPAVAA
ncbi:alpha/beta fold hydrolase [Actinophytocola sp.]|uniref:alpha/beta fold hydrolase n=1 Tax=Actinophytocola sp. TaxID=1872138 RepID=UPI002D803D69|nr:alpha/beta fold hydrolase [Actinophytocola sp.]HET9137762.1 alpha/beta fold hydrolase [Actinophytocola sp.]